MHPVIVHIATQRGIGSLRNTKRRGQSLGARVLPVLFDELTTRTEWPRGIYLFSDMQRATEWQCQLAAQLWNRLYEEPSRFRVFNHPLNNLHRYELLRALFVAERNRYNVYRLDELPAPMRFPVFVRSESQHIGPATGLLHDEAELEEALARLLVGGEDPDDLIVVEFEDVSCGTGIYRKYGAFRLGDRVYTGHMMASTEWTVKREMNDRVLVGEEDLRFVKSNPHAEQVMAAFETAGLTWGRIDYGLVDGQIQVWEINDNPRLGSSLFKRTMGRSLARRVSRSIRRSVWREELNKVVPGPALQFRLDPEAFFERTRRPTGAEESAATLRLES